MTDSASPAIPAEHREDFDAMPEALRTLLLEELAAGNTLAEVGHGFPAAPRGAYFRLTNEVTTRPRASSEGIKFYERNNSSYFGEFADLDRYFFVLESPRPYVPPPDMDTIRKAMEPPPFDRDLNIHISETRDALKRFDDSREMNYDRWKEGTGYDLDALRALPKNEKEAVEGSLIPAKDWRDVEALVDLGTPRALKALKDATKSNNFEVRLAVLGRAPEQFDEETRLETLLIAIDSAAPFGGLSHTLDALQAYHPIQIQEAMFRALLDRGGDIAYHMGTTLAVIHGKISSRFDWGLRPLMLNFNTPDTTERGRAFLWLYDLLEISSKPQFQAVTEIAKSLDHLRK